MVKEGRKGGEGASEDRPGLRSFFLWLKEAGWWSSLVYLGLGISAVYAQASAIATSEEWSSSSFRAILTNFKAEKKTNNVVRLAVQQLTG